MDLVKSLIARSCSPLIIQRNAAVVKSVRVLVIEFNRFRVIGDRTITVALIFSRRAAVEIGFGNGIEFDRFGEIVDRAVVISLTPAYQTATEIWRRVVGVERDGPIEFSQRALQISRVQLLSATIEVVHRRTPINLRASDNDIQQEAEKQQ